MAVARVTNTESKLAEFNLKLNQRKDKLEELHIKLKIRKERLIEREERLRIFEKGTSFDPRLILPKDHNSKTIVFQKKIE